ncbi:hypothetical protein [Hymenobacter algoricola]|uniref:TonB-dependent receptor n=1 Tax=Hymenobacter algoricola TaxID=486267 RepID=A0ABP7N8G6_9BACT
MAAQPPSATSSTTRTASSTNWKLGSRDRLYLSACTGYDKFYARTKDADSADYSKVDSGRGWGNLASALRWNHVVHDQLFMNIHFTYTKYQFNIGITQEDHRRDETQRSSLRYLSNIRDLSLKTDLDYVPNPDRYIRFGGQYILHSCRPGVLQF